MSRPVPPSARAVVIGLDGATWSLLDRLILEGVMPNLDRLRREGVHGPLWSVVPPMTATAWTSYQTGKGPGKHGIYDWTEPVAGTYLYRPIDSTVLQSKTVFELLSDCKKRVATVNLPLTFPARPINGIAIGDMLTPSKDTPGFLYPPEFRATLDQLAPDYLIDTHLTDTEDDILPFLGRLAGMIEGKGKVVRHLMESEPWDMFCCVWVEMDRMQHCLWHIFDALHPRYDAQLAAKYRENILDIYRLLDVRIGEMVDRRPEGSNVFFISDHGFGHCRYKVFLNTWLAQEGFLTFRKGGHAQRERLRAVRGVLDKAGISTRKILDTARKYGGDAVLRGAGDSMSRFAAEIDWANTSAFCHGTNAIRINLAGRERNGSVAPEQYDEVVRRLKERLLAMRDPEGNVIITGVKQRHELYEGPHVGLAADLLIAHHDDSVWFYYSEGDVPESVFEPSGWASGNHKPDGLFCAWGPDIKAGEFREGTSINDIMPTVMALLDAPIPDDVDGEVLRDIVRPGRSLRTRWTEAEQYVLTARSSDAATDRAIEERLRGLGYLQ